MPSFNFSARSISSADVDVNEMKVQCPATLSQLLDTSVITEANIYSNMPYIAITSRQIQMAYAPFILYGKMTNKPTIILHRAAYRIDNPENIQEYLQDTNASENRNTIRIVVVTGRIGVSLKDCFNQTPLDNKAMVVSLSMDARTYVRVSKATDHQWNIITNCLSHGMLLRLATLVPVMFPEYAPEGEHAYPADLMMLLLQNQYEDYCTKLVGWMQTEFGKLRTANRFSGLDRALTDINVAQITMNRNRINRINNDIDNTLRTLSGYYDMIDQCHNQIFALENASMEAATNLLQFIRKNPYIQNATYADTGVINFYVSTPLLYWNTAAAERMLNSTMTNAFTRSKEQLAACKDLLIDQHAQLWMNVAFRLDFMHGNITRHALDPLLDGVPNWHIYNHDCWGSNKVEIQKAVRNGQLEAALAQALVACAALNMQDGVVINGMFNRLCTEDSAYKKPCILLEGMKTLITWSDYKTYLKEKKESEAKVHETTDVIEHGQEDNQSTAAETGRVDLDRRFVAV